MTYRISLLCFLGLFFVSSAVKAQDTLRITLEDAEKQLSANFSVEIPSYASAAGKRMLVPTNLFESRTRQPFAQGERKQPVYFNFPYYVMDETQITFPSTFKMEDLAEVQPIRTDVLGVQGKVTPVRVHVDQNGAMRAGLRGDGRVPGHVHGADPAIGAEGREQCEVRHVGDQDAGVCGMPQRPEQHAQVVAIPGQRYPGSEVVHGGCRS